MPKAGITYGPRIKGPDYAQIAEDARLAAMKDMGVQPTEPLEDAAAKANPAELLKRAAEIVAQADADLGAYADERDRALAHLWFYEQRIGLARTLGMSQMGYRQNLAKTLYGDKKHPLPNAWSKEALARVAEKAGLERVEEAETKLLETHKVVTVARARRDVAARCMQEAVFALSQPPYEWDPERIAEHAGVERKLIYRQRDAARRRRGL